MHTIAREYFMETSLHKFTAEIAELEHGGQLEGRRGLPRRFVIPGVGNGQPFIATKIERREGDLMCVEYQQLLGCVSAVIFND
jgi:hypothetical protein